MIKVSIKHREGNIWAVDDYWPYHHCRMTLFLGSFDKACAFAYRRRAEWLSMATLLGKR